MSLITFVIITLTSSIIMVLSAKFFKWKLSWSGALVGLSISFGPFVFFVIRQFGSWFGGADIGFGLIMMFASLASIPLTLAGYFFGGRLNLRKAILLSLLISSSWIGLSLFYNYLIKAKEIAYNKKSELNCQVLPYHCALRENRLTDLSGIQNSGVNIESKDGWGNTPLVFGLNNFQAARILLELGASSNAISGDGRSLLAIVLLNTTNPDFKLAKLLLKHGAKIDALYGLQKRMTVLNEAISYKNIQVIEFLLTEGANPLVKDDYGLTACERTKLYQVLSLALEAKCLQ